MKREGLIFMIDIISFALVGVLLAFVWSAPVGWLITKLSRGHRND